MTLRKPNHAGSSSAISFEGDALVERVANETRKTGKLSRRNFLQVAGLVGGGHLLSTQLGPLHKAMAGVLAQSAVSAGDGILVMVYLGGGNDGLNTVIPGGAQTGRYRDLRRTLSIGSPIAVSSDTGLHPSFTNVANRFNSGQVALLRNVGYNPPNLSHFSSQDHWATGVGNGGTFFGGPRTGWLGRWYDTVATSNPMTMVSLGSGVPLYARGAVSAALGLPLWAGAALGSDPNNRSEARLVSALRSVGAQPTGFGPLGDKLASVNVRAVDAAVASRAAYTSVDGTSLQHQMLMVANLINANLGGRVFTATVGGFDTHSNQIDWHAQLLTDLDTSIEALMQRLTAAQRAKVTVVTWSEFGRRPQSNDSLGTDHGSASCMLAVGEHVRGGIYGTSPNLNGLDDDGNLVATTDFRQVYASLLRGCLGADDGQILGTAHTPVAFLRNLNEATTTTTSSSTSSTSTSSTSTSSTSTSSTSTSSSSTTSPSTTSIAPSTSTTVVASSTSTPPTSTPPTSTPPTSTTPTSTTPTPTTSTTSTSTSTPASSSTSTSTSPTTTVSPLTAPPTTTPSSSVPSPTTTNPTTTNSTLPQTTSPSTTTPSTTTSPTTTTVAPSSPTTPTLPVQEPVTSTSTPTTTAVPATTTPSTTAPTQSTTTISNPTTTTSTTTARSTTTTSTTTTMRPNQQTRRIVVERVESPVTPPAVTLRPNPLPDPPIELIQATVSTTTTMPPNAPDPGEPIPTTTAVPRPTSSSASTTTRQSPVVPQNPTPTKPSRRSSTRRTTTTVRPTTIPNRLGLRARLKPKAKSLLKANPTTSPPLTKFVRKK